jgi:hypothetical protein
VLTGQNGSNPGVRPCALNTGRPGNRPFPPVRGEPGPADADCYGVMAIAEGSPLTLIGLSAVLVATRIGVTVKELLLAT